MLTQFHKQVAGLTVADAIELNRLALIYEDLGPNGEVIK